MGTDTIAARLHRVHFERMQSQHPTSDGRPAGLVDLVEEGFVPRRTAELGWELAPGNRNVLSLAQLLRGYSHVLQMC